MAELKREENRGRSTSGIISRYALRLTPRICRTMLPDLTAHLIFWSLTAGGFALDLWSKKAVFDWLRQRQPSSSSIINGFLQLVIAENAGAAFGIAAGRTQLFITASVIALAVIFVVFLFSGTEARLAHVVLGLLAAGVCGNLYDRIFNDGLVRDFIDVYYRQYHWPAFNVADSMLCISVVLVILAGFFTAERPCLRRARRRK